MKKKLETVTALSNRNLAPLRSSFKTAMLKIQNSFSKAKAKTEGSSSNDAITKEFFHCEVASYAVIVVLMKTGSVELSFNQKTKKLEVF